MLFTLPSDKPDMVDQVLVRGFRLGCHPYFFCGLDAQAGAGSTPSAVSYSTGYHALSCPSFVASYFKMSINVYWYTAGLGCGQLRVVGPS